MFHLRFARAAVAAVTLSLLIGSVASADVLQGDTDGDTPIQVNNNNIKFGDGICEGDAEEQQILLVIKRQSGTGSGTVFKNGSTVTLTYVDDGGSGRATASMDASPSQISLPGDWVANGDLSAYVTATAVLDTSTPGTWGGNLKFRASGTNTSNAATSADLTVAWSATVLSSDDVACGGGGGGEPTDNPPTVSAGADVGGAEGSAIALVGTASDDGTFTTQWTYAPTSGALAPDAGAACTFASDSATETTITCTDDGEYIATLTANDNVNPPVTDSATVTVTNANPAPNAGADQTVNEGALVSLSGSHTDAGSNDTHTRAWSVVASNGQVITAGAAASYTFRPGDNGTYTATYTVTDDDGGVGSDDAVITVNNVAPTASNAVFAADGTTAFKFNASFSYSDAGWLDTHLGSSIDWTINGASYPAASTVTPAGDTGTPPFETGSVSSSIVLGPGCYTIAASGTALDDDTGSTPVSFTTGYETTPLDVPTAAFLAPIKDSERNFAKWGSVLPVKVSLMSSCNPGQQLSANLYLSYIQGTSGETITGDEVITTSVSSADSGNLMRLNESFYIYNFSTKPLTAGKDYTLRVRYGAANGPILLTAVLNLKK